MVEWYGDRVLEVVRQAAMRGVAIGAESVRSEAISLILSGPKTGRVYQRRGVTHQASAPGEAPASDTGTLVGRIEVEYQFAELTATVGPKVEYGMYLEFGTIKMEPRPFMRPALINKMRFIEHAVTSEIKAALA